MPFIMNVVRSFSLRWVAAVLLLASVSPHVGYAQVEDSLSTIESRYWRAEATPFSEERSKGTSSVVVRPEWTQTQAQTSSVGESIRLAYEERARFPIANYAIRLMAAQACIQRVGNSESARCFPSTVNGTPVTRYPGVDDDRLLVHPKPFVERP